MWRKHEKTPRSGSNDPQSTESFDFASSTVDGGEPATGATPTSEAEQWDSFAPGIATKDIQLPIHKAIYRDYNPMYSWLRAHLVVTLVNTVDGSEIPFPTTWDGAKTL